MRLFLRSILLTSLAVPSALLLLDACSYQLPTVDPLFDSESPGGAGGMGSSGSGFGGAMSSSTGETTAVSSSSSSSSGGVVKPICGDGILEEPEVCDDGNLQSGDGCNAACLAEDHDGCSGPILTLGLGTVVISGTTAGAVDDITRSAAVPPCGAGDRAGADMIYAITPTVPGILTVSLKAEYNYHFLHIRNACPGDDFNEIACDYANSSATEDLASLSVTPGTILYVIADGHLMDEGAFTLTLTLQ